MASTATSQLDESLLLPVNRHSCAFYIMQSCPEKSSVPLSLMMKGLG